MSLLAASDLLQLSACSRLNLFSARAIGETNWTSENNLEFRSCLGPRTGSTRRTGQGFVELRAMLSLSVYFLSQTTPLTGATGTTIPRHGLTRRGESHSSHPELFMQLWVFSASLQHVGGQMTSPVSRCEQADCSCTAGAPFPLISLALVEHADTPFLSSPLTAHTFSQSEPW